MQKNIKINKNKNKNKSVKKKKISAGLPNIYIYGLRMAAKAS
jgi:hypothetical protein